MRFDGAKSNRIVSFFFFSKQERVKKKEVVAEVEQKQVGSVAFIVRFENKRPAVVGCFDFVVRTVQLVSSTVLGR